MRDMYLDLPDGGMSNLNYTLNDGGAELLLKTINYNFRESFIFPAAVSPANPNHR